jgi:hypothetical protein
MNVDFHAAFDRWQPHRALFSMLPVRGAPGRPLPACCWSPADGSCRAVFVPPSRGRGRFRINLHKQFIAPPSYVAVGANPPPYR